MLFLSYFYSSIIHYIFYFAIYILHFTKNIFDKQKSLGNQAFFVTSSLLLEMAVGYMTVPILIQHPV